MRAEQFEPGNKDHIATLKSMGVNVVQTKDGRIQLIHTASSVSNPGTRAVAGWKGGEGGELIYAAPSVSTEDWGARGAVGVRGGRGRGALKRTGSVLFRLRCFVILRRTVKPNVQHDSGLLRFS